MPSFAVLIAARLRASLVFLAALLASTLVAPPAPAQVFFSNTRVGSLVQTHGSVGTSTAAAISSGSVSSSLLAWKICADSANANYLAVGKAADADTDGVRVLAGTCFVCPNCTAGTLKAVNVKGGASSQGYSVIQYKQQ